MPRTVKSKSKSAKGGGAGSGVRWEHRDLLDVASLSAAEIRVVLETAKGFEAVSTRRVKKTPTLNGRLVVNLFFEDSTRTKSSFYLAATRLSADVLDFTARTSSATKGETLRDTARTIEAMGVDAIVVRHSESGAARLLAESVDCAVLNAGDGRHAHPTQGLLDIFTLARRLGRDVPNHAGVSYDLSGLTVGIVGDIAHSRVARSNIHGLTKLGADVVLVGPPTLVSGAFTEIGASGNGVGTVRVSHDLDRVLPELDAINMLRIQFERIGSQQFPSVREYAHLYGLNTKRLAKAKANMVVMHPGPINRGIEIESAVADGPQSVILEQVTAGLTIRMAALYLTIGANERMKKQGEIDMKMEVPVTEQNL